MWTLSCRRAVRDANHRLSTERTAVSLLLDTNVVSELIRKSPSPPVEAWAAGQVLEDLFFSAVGEAELRYGTAIMPKGRRREALNADIERMLHEAFGNRILPFDSVAASAYAEIAAKRRSVGRRIEPIDCQIAAIAHSRGMTVVTRNIRDFEDIGLELINPWSS